MQFKVDQSFHDICLFFSLHVYIQLLQAMTYFSTFLNFFGLLLDDHIKYVCHANKYNICAIYMIEPPIYVNWRFSNRGELW